MTAASLHLSPHPHFLVWQNCHCGASTKYCTSDFGRIPALLFKGDGISQLPAKLLGSTPHIHPPPREADIPGTEKYFLNHSQNSHCWLWSHQHIGCTELSEQGRSWRCACFLHLGKTGGEGRMAEDCPTAHTWHGPHLSATFSSQT